jgi:SAM-dependent methyltransferase
MRLQIRAERAAWHHARRTFGLSYAINQLALRAFRSATETAAYGAERRLLEVEGERGILGPAHRAYRNHSPAANDELWSAWDWTRGGEEWDRGNADFTQSLVREVLRPTLSGCATAVEIGPGAGRWSEEIVALTERAYLADVSERVLALCRERLAGRQDVSYLLSDGRTLGGVPDGTADAVWSFDVFVHIAPVDVASYIVEIARVLRPGGVAAIHHSGRARRLRDPGWRAPMTAALFATLAREAGLTVERQFDSWPGGSLDLDDVITVMRRPDQGR